MEGGNKMKKLVLVIIVFLIVETCAFAGLWDKVKSGVSSAVNAVTGKEDPYKIPEEDFKSACVEMKYREDLMGKAKENDGKYVVIDLFVRQRVDSYFLTYTTINNIFYWEVNWEQPIYIVDTRETSTSVLDGDTIKVWGICKGTKTVLLTTGYRRCL